MGEGNKGRQTRRIAEGINERFSATPRTDATAVESGSVADGRRMGGGNEGHSRGALERRAQKSLDAGNAAPPTRQEIQMARNMDNGQFGALRGAGWSLRQVVDNIFG